MYASHHYSRQTPFGYTKMARGSISSSKPISRANAAMEGKQMNDQLNAATTTCAHVKWLADWRNASDAVNASPDDTIEERTQTEAVQALSVLLATTPAATPESLIALIEWFREDLGEHLLGDASPAQDQIFDTLIKSVEHIDA